VPAKQLVFLGLLALGIPTLGWLLHAVPVLRRWRIAWLVLAPAWIVDVNLFFVPYRGTSSGLELGTPDLIAGALWVSLLLEGRRVNLAPLVAWPVLALGAWAGVSVLAVAPERSLALWELLRMARAYSVFLLAWHLVRAREDVARYLAAVAGFVLLQGVLSGLQVLGGVYRVHGSFAHSNPLGISLVTLSPLLLVALVQERAGRWVYALSFLAGSLGVVYTRSRASLALLGLGAVFVLAVCLARALLRRRRWLVRRIGVLVLGGGLLLLPLAAKVGDGVLRRFREAPASSAESRDRANDAARRMLDDHPLLGVGLNHYVGFLDRGYGDDIEEGDRTIVHHVYWLTGAELGWPGLLLLLGVVLTFLGSGARTILTTQDEWVLHVALALTVGYGLCHLQHLYEWALRKPQVLFQVTALAGVLGRLPRVAIPTTRRPAGAPPLFHPPTPEPA
jgi:hypothetical protein